MVLRSGWASVIGKAAEGGSNFGEEKCTDEERARIKRIPERKKRIEKWGADT